ncbi:hypothetical protein [Enterococcus villorum]|nr:hypothetical protein [Enterococcus villorum]
MLLTPIDINDFTTVVQPYKVVVIVTDPDGKEKASKELLFS